jgi:hypothetical protein
VFDRLTCPIGELLVAGFSRSSCGLLKLAASERWRPFFDERRLIFGLTAALFGEITIDRGRVRQSNFNAIRQC